MSAPSTAIDYGARIERVTAYIWDHLDDPLDLHKLADVACFSPYHFHRIFREFTGETVAQTVRRLRLHRAAAQLEEGEQPISSIATAAGYGSIEAFTRAFAASYGQPPASYRASQHKAPDTPGPEPIDARYEVSVCEFPAMRLAGYPHQGDYQQIGSAFGRFYAWAFPRGIIHAQTRHIGVYYSDETAVPTAELRSFAGVTVAEDFQPEGEVEIVDIPSGSAAMLTHKGPYAQLSTAYRYLYGAWLIGGDQAPGDQPCFEVYLNNPTEVPPTELLTEVWFPLAAS